MATGREKFNFHSNPKERQCQRKFKLPYNVLISHASKIMLKILQVRLQQYVNQELRDVQARFRKGRGSRDQIANICWIREKAREFQKYIYSCSLTMWKPLTVWIATNYGKFLKNGNTRPSYLSPEKPVWRTIITVRTGHGTIDWLKIGKEIHQGCILSLCLFNLYAEYIMWHARGMNHKL